MGVEGIEYIEYKGKRILYANFQGVKSIEESRKLLEREMKMIAESPEPVLLLVNLHDSVMAPENLQYTKDKLAELRAKVKKSGLVGVSGLKPVIVQGISRSTGGLDQQVFGTLDEAKDWLVS